MPVGILLNKEKGKIMGKGLLEMWEKKKGKGLALEDENEWTNDDFSLAMAGV